MNRIRTITAGAAAALVVAGAAVASGAVSSPGVPAAKSLAQAIHDAMSAPPVQGISARITFTNKLIDSSSLTGGGPLLVGASGRLWVAADGRARIELQSDRGDAQIVSDGKTVTIYDASSNTAYKATLPQNAGGHTGGEDHPMSTTPPSVAKISDVLAKIGQAVDLAGPDPTAVAGVGAYSVKLTPHHGGLVGHAELAWDAATGVPLRAGIYASGSTKPVLELAATDISYGAVDAAALSVPIPAGAKIETIDLPTSTGQEPTKAQARAKHAAVKRELTKRAAMSPSEVAAALPFKLSAPDSLAGQPRKAVRLVGTGDHQGALVTYGTGLGGVAVLEMPAKAPAAGQAPPTTPVPTTPSRHRRHGDSGPALKIPTVSVGGAQATELSTALGTLLRFQRAGVQFTVVGSVTPAVAEAAARGL